MMNDGYRDDLEAALARASDLEREIEELRRRNAELESCERDENARRLVAAIDREREEARIRDEQNADDANLRRAVKEVASAQPDADERKYRRTSFSVLGAGAVVALAAGMANSMALGAAAFALFAIGLVYASAADSRARKRRQNGDGR